MALGELPVEEGGGGHTSPWPWEEDSQCREEVLGLRELIGGESDFQLKKDGLRRG